MDIGFIHPRAPMIDATGAAQSATRIVEGLVDHGHSVTVYTNRAIPEPIDAGFSMVELDCSGFPYHSAMQINRAVLEAESSLATHDVVHSYLMRTIPAVGKVSSNTGVPSVVTLNAYGAVCPKNDLRYLDRETCTSNGLMKCARCSVQTSGGHSEYGRVYRSASRLLNLRLVRKCDRYRTWVSGFHALAPHVKRTYAQFGYDTEKITTIPNIVDPAFDVSHESDFSEPYRLLYVGYLRREKGADRLVNLLEYVRSRIIAEVQLTVIGDGELEDKIRQQVRDHDLGDVIDLQGRIPNDQLPSVYASHDLFVYLCRWDEPFGRVFLEAMAAGTPIVATDTGSIKLIVGEAGVVTGQNLSDLGDAIVELLEEESLRRRSGAGKQKVDEYRSSTVVPEFEGLYRSVLYETQPG